jgi:hypothetical protein
MPPKRLKMRVIANLSILLIIFAFVPPSARAEGTPRVGRASACLARVTSIVKSIASNPRPGTALYNLLHSNVHNVGQAVKVLDLLKVRALKAGLINDNHPWVTGISPATGRPIWPDNIAYASPRKIDWKNASKYPAEPDDVIVSRIGKFLATSVKKSTVVPEIPHGPNRRMPHVVNYLHGNVHFNGAFLIFNDFKDAMQRMSDPRFVAEMKRFAKVEKREVMIVLRERDYDPTDYAHFLGFVRATIPWYANANGPKKKVLWGTPSPYAVVNPINGTWSDQLYQLRNGDIEGIVRPPIEAGKYFKDDYKGDRDEATLLEKLHTWGIYNLIKLRGFQGGFVFSDRKVIEPAKYEDYLKTGGKDFEAVSPVPNPLSEKESSGDPAPP